MSFPRLPASSRSYSHSERRTVPKIQAYRADIDGLRAVAVAAVVVDHAFPGALPGGFVGVDVFFVISGFLITRILLDAATEGRDFGLARFYERRARRIFPALFTMFLATAAAGYVLFMPRAAEDLGRCIFYATLFASNLLLRRDVGYFDPAAADNPLLHTWSLGVEEQFYLVFPWLLWLLRRRAPRYTTAVIGALLLASLGAAAWCVARDPNAAFYLPHFRAWELLVGSLLALGALPSVATRGARELLASAGLLAIVVPCFGYDEHTAFPGISAIAPCLGAAALIHAGASGTSRVGALLSTAPFVRLGLISYSLYLWHWPVLVFARYWVIRPLSTLETLEVVGLGLALSMASYAFIERPARFAVLRSRRVVMMLAGGAMACVAAVGYSFAVTGGMPSRFNRERRALVHATDSFALQANVCDEPRYDVGQHGIVACNVGGDPLGPPTFALWGDSHARVLAPAMLSAAHDSGRRGLLLTGAGCPPLLDVTREVPRRARSIDCVGDAAEAAALIERNAKIRDLVLVARWAFYAEGKTYPNEQPVPVVLSDALTTAKGAAGNVAAMERGLDRILDRFPRGRFRVWLLSSVPEVGWNVPSALLRLAITGQQLELAPLRQAYLARQRRALVLLQRVAAKHDATVLRIDAPFCTGERCRVAQDGVPLYADDDHVSVEGAKLVAPIITNALRMP